MKNTSLDPLKTSSNILKRYNFIIFFMILASGLIVAVIMLTNIFTQPNDTNLDGADPNTSDQITTDKINRLENSSTNINYRLLPATRVNPFFE